MQMLDLPADDEGLSWIVSQDPTQLLLIPGLLPGSIVAAAAGDQQAYAHLRLAAQRHADNPLACPLNPLDRICQDMSAFDNEHEICEYSLQLEKKRPGLASLHEDREYHTVCMYNEAAREGKLAALRWMRAICAYVYFYSGTEVIDAAAEGGQLEVIQYLRSRPIPDWWTFQTTAQAAPHLACLKWMLSTDAPGRPCPCRRDILCTIARLHGLSALQWFWANCKLREECWNWQLLMEAARLGDRPMLEWLGSQLPPESWDEGVTAAAASSKDAETMKWLRARQPPCPWDARCCAAAALSRQLDTLIWLRAQDPPCPLGATCALKAVQGGHLAVLEWLIAQEVPLTEDMWQVAAEEGHYHILRYLHRQQVARPETSLTRLCHTPLPILMYLADVGVPLKKKQMQQVKKARRAYCTIHGLVRWCRRAICQPSRGSWQGFDRMAANCSGQLLLTRLCMLPPELVSKITLAARLQRNMLAPSS